MDPFVYLVIFFIIATTVINFIKQGKDKKRRQRQKDIKQKVNEQKQQRTDQTLTDKTLTDKESASEQADFGVTNEPSTTQPRMSYDVDIDVDIYGEDIATSSEGVSQKPAANQTKSTPYQRTNVTPYARDQYTPYKRETDKAYKRQTVTPYQKTKGHQDIFAHFDRRQWRQAIILSEILQPPRAKRPHQTMRKYQ